MESLRAADPDVAEQVTIADPDDDKFINDNPDEQAPAQNDVEEAETSTPGDATEEQTNAETEVVDGEDQDATTEPPSRPSRSEKRIRDLAAKLKQQQEEPVASASQQQSKDNAQVTPPADLPLFQDGENLSVDEANKRLVQAADAIAQARISQALGQYEQRQQGIARASQLDADLASIETKYPALNPDSSDHDANLTAKVSQLYETAVAGNPNLRLADFVDGVMDLANITATKQSSKVTKSLVKQAAEGAVTPSTKKQSGKKAFSDMSLDEMEQHLGFA